MVRPERFERPTPWFVAKYSIQLSYGRTARAAHYTEFFLKDQPFAKIVEFAPAQQEIATLATQPAGSGKAQARQVARRSARAGDHSASGRPRHLRLASCAVQA